MRTFTNQTTEIYLEYPESWEPGDLTAITIQIDDVAGNELLAATPAGLYTQSTLDSDALRYTRSITLADGSEDLAVGDMIRIGGILGNETHVVKGWDSANLVAELEDFVDRNYEAGATVDRLSAVATVDFSDADVYVPGIQMVLTWTPTGTGGALTELAEIESFVQIDVASFVRDFSAIYHRAYTALRSPNDRLQTVIRLAQDELRLALASRLLDIGRIKDQTLLNPPLMALVAKMWAMDGDEQTSDESDKYSRAYSAALEMLCQHPVWVDLDNDGVQDNGETNSHPLIFERQW